MKACGVCFGLLLLFSSTVDSLAACGGETTVQGRTGGYASPDGNVTSDSPILVGGNNAGGLRNWILFDLPRPQGRVTGATLRISSVHDDTQSLRYELFDVVSDLQTLTNAGANTSFPAAYLDFGQGVKFGEQTFNTFGFFTITMPLNTNFIAQLNAGVPRIALGGKLSTPTGSSVTPVLFQNNFAQSVSLTLSYDISGPPYLTQAPFSFTNVAGRMLQLNANSCGAEPMSHQWFRDGGMLQGATNQVLIIPQAQLSDAGLYSVTVSNHFGGTNGVIADVAVQPFIFHWQAYPTQPVYLGGQIYLQLYVEAGQPFSYAWLRNGTNLVGSGTSDGFVTFLRQNATSDDAGQYLCLVGNEYGTDLSPTVYVEVIAQAPRFVQQPASTTFAAGETRYLQAYADGGPPPSLQWYFGDMPIPGATNSGLELRSARVEHAGNYRALASNELGTAWSETAIVTITVAAPAIASLDGRALVEGDWFTFKPLVTGSPPLTFRWFFNGSELPGETRRELTLLNVTAAQQGTYRLTVSNPAGTASATASLLVGNTGPLDDWDRLAPDPTATYLYFTAFAEGKLVAVGENGTILLLGSDGLWRNASVPTLSHIRSVAYGNGLFVAVADTGILYSSDGLQWAFAPYQFDQRPNVPSLAFGNGRFLLTANNLGNGPIGHQPVLTSVDGETWQQEPLGTPQFTRSIRFVGGRFFAAHGWNLLSSTDAVSWTSFSATNEVEDVAFSTPDHRWVAVGDDGLIMTSTDATNWISVLAPLSTRLISVRYKNGVFAAVGARGGLCHSRDGLNWSLGNSGTFDRLEDLGFADFGNANSRFIAVGEAGTMIASRDGTNWFRENFGSTSDLEAMTTGPGRLVAVGKDGLILTSTNGLHFQPYGSGNTNLLHDVVYAEGQYVAVGDEGALARSTDGVNWTWTTLGTNIYFKGITFGEGQFVAVGSFGAIFTSSDAVQWAPRNSTTSRDVNAVASGNDVFAAAADRGIVLYSEDGSAWFSINLAGVNLRDVVFINNHFIIAGNDGFIFSSTNGFQWTYRPIGFREEGFNLRSITYANGIYMIVGNEGAVMTSPDLQTWRRRRAQSFFNLHGVQPWGDRFVAVGNGGTVLLSESIRPVLSAAGAGNFFNLILEGEPMVYQLEASSDLVNWTSIGALNNTEFRATFTVPAEGMRFFRAQTP